MFTGRADKNRGSFGANEDLSPIVSILSKIHCPLLHALGDAETTVDGSSHTWYDNHFYPITDAINDATYANALTDTSFVVENAAKFRVGDLIKIDAYYEIMQVTDVNTGTNTLTVTRGYGSTVAEALFDNAVLVILASPQTDYSAVLERNQAKVSKSNVTQIFTAYVNVTDSSPAVGQDSVAAEAYDQKTARLAELLRNLELSVIHSRYDAGARRTMGGLLQRISTSVFEPGVGNMPADPSISEGQINYVIGEIYKLSRGTPDMIVFHPSQRRVFNAAVLDHIDQYRVKENTDDYVAVYESDFGICTLISSQWMQTTDVLLLDSKQIQVIPRKGKSFQYISNTNTNSSQVGQLLGEYTLEIKNEECHGRIKGLSV